MPIASILFLIERIWRNPFTCNYLKNKKLFLHFFLPFLKSSLNFEHFQKKDDSPSVGISEIGDSEKHGYINVWKVPFQGILRKRTWKTRQNIVEILMAGSLPYLFVTVKAIDLQKVSLSDMQNLKTVSKHTEWQWELFSF